MSKPPAPKHPWAATAQERAAISAAANELVGETIRGVRYLVPAGADVSSHAAPVHYEGFDWISPVGMGIEFETTSDQLFFAVWILEQDACGISIGPGSVASRLDIADLLPVAVTDTESWRPHIGSKITGVDLHWGRVNTEGLDTVWSVRLSLSDSNAVEIALASVNDLGELEPSNDDLVVIFDEQLALAQRRRDDATSAHWKRVSHQPFKALDWIRWRIRWRHVIRESRQRLDRS